MNALTQMLDFATVHGLLVEEDRDYARNALLAALGLYAPPEDSGEDSQPLPRTIGPILSALTDVAAAHGMVDDSPSERDRFGEHLISLILPPPSVVTQRFHSIYDRRGAAQATNWFYDFCKASNAIHVDAIKKNVGYLAPSPYGKLQITINLSKPEKDPREIARQKTMPSVGYPLCMLCKENEGYAGRPGYPSHETLRTVQLRLCGEAWRLQFSPYSYYDEHCIVLNEKHVPMVIEKKTFALLCDFVDQFPAYFIGSNADLPIVGGSILSHNHFQGGRHASAGVLHETEGQPHNTITPIARKAGKVYRMRLVLRNNRTDAENPLGIFHPHANLHHIKRENIGLIEVMGLFILPGRLQAELAGLEGYLTGEKPLVPPAQDDPLFKHFEWVRALAGQYGAALAPEEAKDLLRRALSEVCAHVLEDAGVFKLDAPGQAAFEKFLAAFGLETEE